MGRKDKLASPKFKKDKDCLWWKEENSTHNQNFWQLVLVLKTIERLSTHDCESPEADMGHKWQETGEREWEVRGRVRALLTFPFPGAINSRLAHGSLPKYSDRIAIIAITRIFMNFMSTKYESRPSAIKFCAAWNQNFKQSNLSIHNLLSPAGQTFVNTGSREVEASEIISKTIFTACDVPGVTQSSLSLVGVSELTKVDTMHGLKLFRKNKESKL